MATRPVKPARSVQRLLVFLPSAHKQSGKAPLSSATVVPYVAVGNGPVRAETGEAPIALLPKATQVDLVFATGDIFIAAIDTPKLNEARLRQALPNLLEDRLLSDASECHFAFAIPKPSDMTTIAESPKLPVAVIDRGLLTRALDAVGEAGYRPRAAYDEIYTVPAPSAGVLSVRVERGRGVARIGKHDGFTFEMQGDTAPPALVLAIRQLGAKRIEAFGRDAGKLAAMAASIGVEVHDTQRDADLAATDGAVNLLQGSFASGGMLGGFMFSGAAAGLGGLKFSSIKAPLAWAGAAAAVFIAGMNAYYWKLDAESTAIKSQMETAFRSAFSDATAVVDPVIQTKRSLGGLRARAGVASADDFSVLNAQAVQLLTIAPIGSVAGVEYRDGVLKVKFKPGNGDNGTLQNTLRAQAIQQGLTARFDPDGAMRLQPAGQ